MTPRNAERPGDDSGAISKKFEAPQPHSQRDHQVGAADVLERSGTGALIAPSIGRAPCCSADVTEILAAHRTTRRP